MDRLSARIDGSNARWGQNYELLGNVLADVLEEGSLAGSSPSCKEEALVGSCDEVVCILHLLVCRVENLCLFHVMFVLAFILVTSVLLLSVANELSRFLSFRDKNSGYLSQLCISSILKPQHLAGVPEVLLHYDLRLILNSRFREEVTAEALMSNEFGPVVVPDVEPDTVQE